MRGESLPFEALDFLYMPTQDVEADVAYYTEMLHGELVFAIEAFGARVAQVRVADTPVRLLIADHLGGEAPVLVHRVADLNATVAELERRGVSFDAHFGIPHGPAAAFRTPGGQRHAVYELTRPGADGRLAGRFDFAGG